MNVVTLYESSDLKMRKSLDRYLSQLSRNGNIRIWNDDLVQAGENTEAIVREELKKADLILLLFSQDFLASPACYELAQTALQLCRENPKKKIVPVLLRPNSIEDTPFKEFPQLPAQNVCITQYKDPEQGYWDTYQGLKKIIDPRHRYKKRPKIATLQAALIGLSVLLLWSFFILLLPVIHPQEGIRIVPRPFLNKADSSIYYKIYKLDGAAQKGVVLFFLIEPADTIKYGQLQHESFLNKRGDENWKFNQTMSAEPDLSQQNENGDYFCQCVVVNFNKNDEGEYHYKVKFSKLLDNYILADFDKKLLCGHSPCMDVYESNCENVAYFSSLHYLYLKETRFYTTIFVFILTTLLLTTIFTIKKISSYAKRDSHNPTKDRDNI